MKEDDLWLRGFPWSSLCRCWVLFQRWMRIHSWDPGRDWGLLTSIVVHWVPVGAYPPSSPRAHTQSIAYGSMVFQIVHWGYIYIFIYNLLPNECSHLLPLFSPLTILKQKKWSHKYMGMVDVHLLHTHIVLHW